MKSRTLPAVSPQPDTANPPASSRARKALMTGPWREALKPAREAGVTGMGASPARLAILRLPRCRGSGWPVIGTSACVGPIPGTERRRRASSASLSLVSITARSSDGPGGRREVRDLAGEPGIARGTGKPGTIRVFRRGGYTLRRPVHRASISASTRSVLAGFPFFGPLEPVARVDAGAASPGVGQCCGQRSPRPLLPPEASQTQRHKGGCQSTVPQRSRAKPPTSDCRKLRFPERPRASL